MNPGPGMEQSDTNAFQPGAEVSLGAPTEPAPSSPVSGPAAGLKPRSEDVAPLMSHWTEPSQNPPKPDSAVQQSSPSPAPCVSPPLSPPPQVQQAKPEEVTQHVKETLVTGPGKTADYEWDAKYAIQLTGDKMTVDVRIKIVGKVSEKIKKEWLDGICSKWNDKFHFTNNTKTTSISLNQIFTDKDPQQVATI